MPFGRGLLKKARKKGRRREKKKRLAEKVKRGKEKLQRDRKGESERWRAERCAQRMKKWTAFISHQSLCHLNNKEHPSQNSWNKKRGVLLFQNKEMRLHVRAFHCSPHKSWLFSLFCGATDIFFGRGGWQKERHKWREKVRNKNGHSDRQTKRQTKSQTSRGRDWHASSPTSQQTSL